MGVGGCQAPATLPPRERPGTHCIGGWVGPVLVWMGAGNLAPTRIRSLDRQACSKLLYQLSYLGHDITSSSDNIATKSRMISEKQIENNTEENGGGLFWNIFPIFTRRVWKNHEKLWSGQCIFKLEFEYGTSRMLCVQFFIWNNISLFETCSPRYLRSFTYSYTVCVSLEQLQDQLGCNLWVNQPYTVLHSSYIHG